MLMFEDLVHMSKESFKTEHECEWSLAVVHGIILMERVKLSVSENYGESPKIRWWGNLMFRPKIWSFGDMGRGSSNLRTPCFKGFVIRHGPTNLSHPSAPFYWSHVGLAHSPCQSSAYFTIHFSLPANRLPPKLDKWWFDRHFPHENDIKKKHHFQVSPVFRALS